MMTTLQSTTTIQPSSIEKLYKHGVNVSGVWRVRPLFDKSKYEGNVAKISCAALNICPSPNPNPHCVLGCLLMVGLVWIRC